MLTALTALAIETCFGYPARIFKTIGHPVTWIGALIGFLEKRLNSSDRSPTERRFLGIVALVVTLAVTVAVAVGTVRVVSLVLDGAAFLALGLLGSSLLAQRSLHDHVADVAAGLAVDLQHGREAIAHIVGRDPQSLDAAAVARAAIESLAENFSDGIVAPIFYMAGGGLPAAVAYKTINTADSMIGHRSPRYAAYGWSAARLDDLVNLPASRLAAFLIISRRRCCRGAARLNRPGRSGAMRAVIAHRMPVGRRQRWPEPWDCDWPVRDPTMACWSSMSGWAAGEPMRRPSIFWRRFRSIASPARLRRVR